MLRRPILALIALMTGFNSPTPAQEATFTQIGTWECSVAGRPAKFVCPTVTFPEAFATITGVILIGCATDGTCYGRNYVEYSNLTSSGFNPQLLMGGKFDWRGMELEPRKVLGNWIAVGTRLGPVTPSAATRATLPSTQVTARRE